MRAKVYKAQIDGRPVAVKVQRPDLLEAVGLDFYVARRVAEAITRLSRSSSFFGGRLVVRSDLVAAVDEYGSRLFEELDYRKEVLRRFFSDFVSPTRVKIVVLFTPLVCVSLISFVLSIIHLCLEFLWLRD